MIRNSVKVRSCNLSAWTAICLDFPSRAGTSDLAMRFIFLFMIKKIVKILIVMTSLSSQRFLACTGVFREDLRAQI